MTKVGLLSLQCFKYTLVCKVVVATPVLKLKYSSKKTIDKLVCIMIKERILKEDKKNKKKIILFVNKNNLLGSIPQELETIQCSFYFLSR